MAFRIMANEFVVSLQGILGWYGNDGQEIRHPDYSKLRSINEVLIISIQLPTDTTFETGFVDLLIVHSIYIYSAILGHYNSSGVRGEHTIMNKCMSPAVSAIESWIRSSPSTIKLMCHGN